MEISKAEVMRRLREAGYTPDPEPATKLPIIPEAPPSVTERHDEDGEPSFLQVGDLVANVPQRFGARPTPRDPHAEPWMIWISRMWSDEHLGVPQTHVHFCAARNQHSYRTEGHWSVGFCVPGWPGPDEFIYHCERELSDVVGRSCRITHFDGKPVVL
jgi:hypothetical protein